MKGKLIGILAVTCCWLVAAPRAVAIDRVVATTAELSSALEGGWKRGIKSFYNLEFMVGDTIGQNLRNVTIRSL